jgi:hypothetical protein
MVSDTPRAAGLAGWYDWLASGALVALWLLPILWTGITNRNVPLTTTWMQQQYRVACLFVDSVKAWSTYFVQVQHQGSTAWIELDLRGVFDMTVFGFRSRLHAILEETYLQPRGELRLDAIAEFIRRRYEQQHLLGPRLAALRFVNVSWTVRELARETGAFSKGTLADWVFRDWLILGEKRWDGKRPTYPLWGGVEKPPRKGKFLKPQPDPSPLAPERDLRVASEPHGRASRRSNAPMHKTRGELEALQSGSRK